MKYFFLVIYFTIAFYNGSAQQSGNINDITATIIPNSKVVTTTVTGSNLSTRIDTSFTLILVLNTSNIDLSEKVVVKMGSGQDSADVKHVQYQFTDHNIPNNKCVHTDDNSNVECAKVKFDRIQLYYTVSTNDFDKLKWITAFVKHSNSQSPKKYYEIK